MTAYNTLQGSRLQPWYSIEILEENGYKQPYICSRIHMVRRIKTPHCYGTSWSDLAILNDPDLYRVFVSRYGSDCFI